MLNHVQTRLDFTSSRYIVLEVEVGAWPRAPSSCTTYTNVGGRTQPPAVIRAVPREEAIIAMFLQSYGVDQSACEYRIRGDIAG